MKLYLKIFFILVLGISCHASAQKDKKDDLSKKDSIDGVYIPANLDDCIRHIDAMWSDSVKNEVMKMTEEEFISRAHFGFGLWMRNNWGLWAGSRLAVYFNGIGIFHPDDMSAIILTSYYRKLKGENIRLDEQVKYYQNYWKKQ